MLSSGFSNGTGPIFLDQLDCQGTENTLLECNAFTPQRLLICDHSQDVAIRCTGRLYGGRVEILNCIPISPLRALYIF